MIKETTETLQDIIKIGLQASGYSGLYNNCEECGCGLSDLAPFETCFKENCQPAYLHKHSTRPDDWIISIKKDGVTDGEIEDILDANY